MGADPNSIANGLTPLMYASIRDSLRIIQLLISYQANIHTDTPEGLNMLDYAILYGNFSIAKFLIDHQSMKPRYNADEYSSISERKKIYYVNYHSLLGCLTLGCVP